MIQKTIPIIMTRKNLWKIMNECALNTVGAALLLAHSACQNGLNLFPCQRLSLVSW